MRFGRLLVVTIVITICGGVFGGMVGGLIGFATPSSIEAIFGVNTDQAAKDAKLLSQSKTERNEQPSNANETNETKVKVGVNMNPQQGDENMTAYGAALGGASGLIIGAIFGMMIATVDQILLVIREKTKHASSGTN